MIGPTSIAEHDFHVSITKIELNLETKRLEVMIKLFTDDLSIGLNGHAGTDLKLGTQNEPPNANDQLKKYVLEKVSILVNGRPTELNYLGKQQEGDATWIFIESERVGKVNTVEIANPLLIDLFEDQANLINLNINGKKSGMTLRKGETSGKKEFN